MVGEKSHSFLRVTLKYLVKYYKMMGPILAEFPRTGAETFKLLSALTLH